MKKLSLISLALVVAALVAGLGLAEKNPAEKKDSGEKPPSLQTKPAPAIKWKKRFRAKTGSLPKAVVLTPDQSQAWVTNFGHDHGKSISVFDAHTGKLIKYISMSGRAVELAFSLDGKTAYVSNFDKGRLYAIDTGTYKITGSVYTGKNPKIVTLSPSGDRIYVSNWTSNTVSAVDPKTLKVVGTAKVGTAPRGSDTDATGKYLFVANFNSHNLSIVETASMKEIKKLKMGRHPRHVLTTPDGKSVLVSNMGRGSDTVAVVDPVELVVKKWIKVARGPKAMAVSPDSRYAFTANYFAHSVSIIDLAAGKQISAIPDLGKSPCGMDMSKDGRVLYLTSWKSNDLWALEIFYP